MCIFYDKVFRVKCFTFLVSPLYNCHSFWLVTTFCYRCRPEARHRLNLLVIKYLFVICYLLSRSYLTFIQPSTQTKRERDRESLHSGRVCPACLTEPWAAGQLLLGIFTSVKSCMFLDSLLIRRTLAWSPCLMSPSPGLTWWEPRALATNPRNQSPAPPWRIKSMSPSLPSPR